MDATTLRDPAVIEKLKDYFPIHVIADVPNKPPAKDLLAPSPSRATRRTCSIPRGEAQNHARLVALFFL